MQNFLKLKYHPQKSWYFCDTTKVGTGSGLYHQQNTNKLTKRVCKYHPIRYLCDVTSPRGFSVFFTRVLSKIQRPWLQSPSLLLYHKPTIAPATTTNSRRCGRPRSCNAETVAFANDVAPCIFKLKSYHQSEYWGSPSWCLRWKNQEVKWGIPDGRFERITDILLYVKHQAIFQNIWTNRNILKMKTSYPKESYY